MSGRSNKSLQVPRFTFNACEVKGGAEITNEALKISKGVFRSEGSFKGRCAAQRVYGIRIV